MNHNCMIWRHLITIMAFEKLTNPHRSRAEGYTKIFLPYCPRWKVFCIYNFLGIPYFQSLSIHCYLLQLTISTGHGSAATTHIFYPYFFIENIQVHNIVFNNRAQVLLHKNLIQRSLHDCRWAKPRSIFSLLTHTYLTQFLPTLNKQKYIFSISGTTYLIMVSASGIAHHMLMNGCKCQVPFA